MRRAEAGPLSNHPFFFETQHTLRAPLPLPYCYLVFSTHHLKPKHHSIQQPLVRPANTPDSGSANALKWRRCRRLPCSRWCICKTALSTCPRRWHRCYPMPMRPLKMSSSNCGTVPAPLPQAATQTRRIVLR
ncbi:hypothetical protein VTI28DRAFT_1886 [Corynascus sepedonium]